MSNLEAPQPGGSPYKNAEVYRNALWDDIRKDLAPSQGDLMYVLWLNRISDTPDLRRFCREFGFSFDQTYEEMARIGQWFSESFNERFHRELGVRLGINITTEGVYVDGRFNLAQLRAQLKRIHEGKVPYFDPFRIPVDLQDNATRFFAKHYRDPRTVSSEPRQIIHEETVSNPRRIMLLRKRIERERRIAEALSKRT